MFSICLCTLKINNTSVHNTDRKNGFNRNKLISIWTSWYLSEQADIYLNKLIFIWTSWYVSIWTSWCISEQADIYLNKLISIWTSWYVSIWTSWCISEQADIYLKKLISIWTSWYLSEQSYIYIWTSWYLIFNYLKSRLSKLCSSNYLLFYRLPQPTRNK